MSKHLACPTEIIDAPIDVVWQLLTDLAGWGRFFDVRVIRVEPRGPASVGQRLFGESGPRWLHLRVSIAFTRIDEPRHELELDARLPFGITVHEVLDCLPLENARCRVNYHCHIGLPDGWRGALLLPLLGRELVNGPADSLRRLKRAAEFVHQGESQV